MFKIYLIYQLLLIVLISNIYALDWPIPYQPSSYRPTNDPFCQAGLQAFCPTGKTTNPMPVVDPNDRIEVFALKKPVWSFKYGPLLGYFHIMHDGVGFRSMNTGLNWTMEWYELDQLFNCTFPHVLADNSFIWCNQGALCVYDGINDTTWTQYGTLQKVAEISGTLFNQFANWSIYDNNTNIYYETWTVYSTNNTQDPTRVMYFDSFDCASWVLRAFNQLYVLGATFNASIYLNYTRLNLYSQEPVLIGNYSQIFNSNNQTLIDDIRHFYRTFQKPNGYLSILEQGIEAYYYIEKEQRFYFYYNDLYWYLSLKHPFMHVTYYQVPLPGTN